MTDMRLKDVIFEEGNTFQKTEIRVSTCVNITFKGTKENPATMWYLSLDNCNLRGFVAQESTSSVCDCKVINCDTDGSVYSKNLPGVGVVTRIGEFISVSDTCFVLSSFLRDPIRSLWEVNLFRSLKLKEIPLPRNLDAAKGMVNYDDALHVKRLHNHYEEWVADVIFREFSKVEKA